MSTDAEARAQKEQAQKEQAQKEQEQKASSESREDSDTTQPASEEWKIQRAVLFFKKICNFRLRRSSWFHTQQNIHRVVSVSVTRLNESRVAKKVISLDDRANARKVKCTIKKNTPTTIYTVCSPHYKQFFTDFAVFRRSLHLFIDRPKIIDVCTRLQFLVLIFLAVERSLCIIDAIDSPRSYSRSFVAEKSSRFVNTTEASRDFSYATLLSSRSRSFRSF